jgi:hypothetical protein
MSMIKSSLHNPKITRTIYNGQNLSLTLGSRF